MQVYPSTQMQVCFKLNRKLRGQQKAKQKTRCCSLTPDYHPPRGSNLVLFNTYPDILPKEKKKTTKPAGKQLPSPTSHTSSWAFFLSSSTVDDDGNWLTLAKVGAAKVGAVSFPPRSSCIFLAKTSSSCSWRAWRGWHILPVHPAPSATPTHPQGVTSPAFKRCCYKPL